MRYERADGSVHEVAVSVEDILEAEKVPGFNFLKAVTTLQDARFTDWVNIASMLTVDGEKPGYGGLLERGFTFTDLVDMFAGVVSDLGFTSGSTA